MHAHTNDLRQGRTGRSETRGDTMTPYPFRRPLALLLACGALLAPPVFGLDVDDSGATHTHAGIYTDDSTRAGIYTDDSLHAAIYTDDSL
jgi:hypothetical protein